MLTNFGGTWHLCDLDKDVAGYRGQQVAENLLLLSLPLLKFRVQHFFCLRSGALLDPNLLSESLCLLIEEHNKLRSTKCRKYMRFPHREVGTGEILGDQRQCSGDHCLTAGGCHG